MEIPIVVIAEKNSVAVEIAKVFPEYIVTSVAGHIKKITFKKYSNAPWLKTKLEDLLKDQLIYVNSEYASKSLSNIRSVKKLGPIHLILAMDPDQEGDLIAQHVLKEFSDKELHKVSKIKLESLSKKGITQAFTKLEPLSGSEGHSADLRTRLDLLFGSILSRYISLESFKCSNRWVTFNSGRVQTPTLKFVQDRTRERAHFNPEVYYMLKIEDNPYIGAHSLSKKYTTPPTTESTVMVSHTGSTEYIVPPRSGLNTDELLNLLSKEHAVFKKINSATTNLLSAMYLSGKISYPRTDNNTYANYIDLLTDTVKLYEQQFKINAIVPTLVPSKVVTDHSPITPLVSSSTLTDPLEKKVLGTLYNHLKKVLSGPNVYKKHTFSTQIHSESVSFSILEPITRVFEDGLTYSMVKPEPLFEVKVSVLEKTTKPPAHYNSASLLKQMKKEGVGTKSTRATILEGLLKNEYLKYTENDLLITNKGDYLCNYWSSRWPNIVSPELTKNIERLFPLPGVQDVTKNYEYYCKLLDELLRVKKI